MITFLILGLIVNSFYLVKYRKATSIFDLLLFISFHLIFTFQGLYFYFTHFRYSKLPLTVINNLITYESAVKASFCVFLFLVIFSLLYKPRLWYRKEANFKYNSNYTLIYLITFCFIYLLITKTGGLIGSITNPGQNIGGQTFLILSVTSGKIPFLIQFITRRVRVFDGIIYAIIFLVTLFNSRFIAITMLVELVILYTIFYNRIKLSQILYLGLISLFIIFGYGLYRDFSYRFEAKTFNSFISYFKEVDFNIALEWFFLFNIEGFSGLSNVIRVVDEGKSFDYGLSQLNAIFSIIPNSLKTSDNLIFKELMITINSKFPAQGSVVPSPLEIFYGNFGIIGILLYAVIFSAILTKLNKFISLSNSINIILGAGLLSLCLSGFRGNIIGILIFFGLFAYLSFAFYSIIIKIKWNKK